MGVLEIVSFVFGACGFSAALWCYWELWKWARQCQGARITIAFKRKVQFQAPLVEWLLWSRQLDSKENGRVVYRNGGVTVAIINKPKTISPLTILKEKYGKKPQTQPSPAPTNGRWTAEDQTVKS